MDVIMKNVFLEILFIFHFGHNNKSTAFAYNENIFESNWNEIFMWWFKTYFITFLRFFSTITEDTHVCKTHNFNEIISGRKLIKRKKKDLKLKSGMLPKTVKMKKKTCCKIKHLYSPD